MSSLHREAPRRSVEVSRSGTVVRMLEDGHGDDTPAGVEVVRLISAASDGDERQEAAVVDSRPALMRRARGEARGVLAAELASASLIDHDHVIVPFDHWTEGAWLVVAQPLPEQTLADWIQRHGPLASGAAVTVLVPMLELIDRLHALGIAGVRLDPGMIALDSAGTPRLMLEGAIRRTRTPTPKWRLEDPSVAGDVHAALNLLGSLCGVQSPPDGVVEAIRDGSWRRACDELTDWATPVPLEAAVPVADAAASARAPAPTRRALRSTRRARPELATALRAFIGRGLRAGRALSDAVAEVRPRVWVLGSAGATAVIVAAVMMMSNTDAGVGAEPAATAVAAAEHPTAAVGEPADSAEHHEPEQESQSAIPEGDVVGTLTALLAERERCLDAADMECLSGVVQEGSLLFRDDAAGTPAWRASAAPEVTVTEDLGDAVVVSIDGETGPASMLAVSTEAGWMIREIWLGQ